MKYGCAALIAVVFSLVAANGQDRRKVTEPVIPPSCVVLTAELHAQNNALAEADESKTDTVRIQKALDECGAGKAVELKGDSAHNAFLSGPLELREGVTLLVDKGVTLYASRNPADFDGVPGGCGVSGPESRGCKPLIHIHGVHNAAVMGDGTIDGRGDKIVIGKTYTWWQQSRAAEPTNARYSNFRLIVADHADGLILYRIHLHNSPNFHVTVNSTDGFTAWGVHLLTPTVRGLDARNTDGIDPGGSQDITITKSWIDNGDDNVAIKTGVHYMSVLDNHFYSGHGMSIGSETFTTDGDLLVDTLTLDHTTSGVRIKSNVQRGGPVNNLTYRNLCMRDVPFPISISPFYNGQTTDGIDDLGLKGAMIPDYKSIHLENVHSLTPGIVQIAGLNAEHITQVTLDGVVVDHIAPDQARARNADITIGPHGANFTFQGEGVTVHPSAAHAPRVSSCKGVFVPYRD